MSAAPTAGPPELLRRVIDGVAIAPRRDATVMAGEPPAASPAGEAPPGPDWLERELDRARPVADGGAYTRLLGAQARSAAARVAPDAPLSGFSFAVKDLIAVRGLPVGAGSAVRAAAPAEPADAPVVAALRAAGAVCVGTVALHELAFGVTGSNAYTGAPINPRDPSLLPGGSSSGSAVAVAERSARIALGTDTGGSIRIPAALTGVVGFKPARAGAPPPGVFPLSPTLDHVGWIARSVADLAAVRHALGGAVAQRGDPLAIGVAVDDLEAASPEVATAMEGALVALERAGCSLRPVAMPDPERVFALTTAIMFSEAAAVHAGDLRECPERYGDDVRDRLGVGSALPATAYVAALEGRRETRDQIAATLEGLDCVVGPTLGTRAPRVDEAGDPAVPAALVACTRLANLTGAPAASLPLGDPGVALQLTGRTDAGVLAAAACIEAALG